MYINTITLTFKIQWRITGHDDYAIVDHNLLVNVKRGRIVKQVMNGGSIGYCLNGKFYTLSKLRPLLVKPKVSNIPF